MKRAILFAASAVYAFVASGAGAERTLEEAAAMAPFYGELWNDEVQSRIDADIEANRKADAAFALPAPDGTQVEIEQIDHEFVFGAHMFNFNQLGKKEWNDRHKAMWGEGGIFNQATVAFYWKDHEPEPGRIRDNGSYEDSEWFWNSLPREEAMKHPYWRRPAPGPVVAWCREHGVRVHGHCLAWGHRAGFPEWTWYDLCPKEERFAFREFGLAPGDGKLNSQLAWRRFWTGLCSDLGDAAVESMLSECGIRLRDAMCQRVERTVERYGDLVDSWDVINESCVDWTLLGRKSRTGKTLRASPHLGPIPGDMPLLAFRFAQKAAKPGTLLAINDYKVGEDYRDQILDLEKEGARIDIAGCQMHIMSGETMLNYANGDAAALARISPAHIQETLDTVAEAVRPIHVSEITIPAPDRDERGLAIQALVARNFYRACFAHKAVMGITWWNTIDRTYKNELLDSGLYTENMERKPVHDALDNLVNNEWKTRLAVPVSGGRVSFRGFRGSYSLSWKCPECGRRHVRIVSLSGDGANEKAGSAKKVRCRRPLFHATVDGRRMSLADGEEFFDVKKLYPGEVVKGRDGTKRVEVVFSIIAPKDGEYEIQMHNDYYGELSVDGAVPVETKGPWDVWSGIVIPLKAGENRISFKTRSGSGGKWEFGFRLPFESPLSFGKD